MNTLRACKISVAAALAICAASAVAAQGGPRGERGWGMWGNDGPGWGTGMGMMWGRGPWGGRGSDWMLERIEGRLAFMKAELKITEAQTTAWSQLADVIRTAAKHRNERMKSVLRRAKSLRSGRASEQFMSLRWKRSSRSSRLNRCMARCPTSRKGGRRDGHSMVGMGGPGLIACLEPRLRRSRRRAYWEKNNEPERTWIVIAEVPTPRCSNIQPTIQSSSR